jgi:hypothetical protein
MFLDSRLETKTVKNMYVKMKIMEADVLIFWLTEIDFCCDVK